MARQIDFVGKSGTLYRYSVQDSGRPVQTAGANFVIAVLAPTEVQVLHVGETENLASRDWIPALEQARARHGQTELLVRLNVRGAVRKQECEDMTAAYVPSLNLS